MQLSHPASVQSSSPPRTFSCPPVVVKTRRGNRANASSSDAMKCMDGREALCWEHTYILCGDMFADCIECLLAEDGQGAHWRIGTDRCSRLVSLSQKKGNMKEKRESLGVLFRGLSLFQCSTEG